MNVFQIIAIILALSALGAYLNERFLKLPATISSVAFACCLSVLAIIVHKLGYLDLASAKIFVQKIDFSAVVLQGILSFLLFAGALGIDYQDLKGVKWAVALLSTLGVLLATLITGSLLWLFASMIGLSLPYIYSLLFGALISPTDPIAVLSILKEAGISKQLYAKIGAESLFNDGVGVVLFLTILGIINQTTQPTFLSILELLCQKALGGAMLGILLGWLSYRMISTISAHKVEILVTLALVSGGYFLAESLGVSGPISMVCFGLVFGNHGRNVAMSPGNRERLDDFWEILDELLNVALFLLIGIEMIVINLSFNHILLGLLAILSVLIGRIFSVAIAMTLINFKKSIDWRMIGLLTWGGLRGGLSIAMALSLAGGAQKNILVPITYLVVLFSILVQGLSFKSSLKFLIKKN